MASTHGNLVLPPSRPVAEGGTEDHRSRRAIAPPIASRLSESAFASGPPKVSSPRCSPDAYSSSLCDEVPHIFIQKSHLEPREFLISSAKRLLQQYRTLADKPSPTKIHRLSALVGALASLFEQSGASAQ